METYELFIRATQWYLLALALFAFLYALKTGPVLNTLRFSGSHIYYSYTLVFLLSLAQIKQCITLLIHPIGATWWYALFCKQVSIFVYIAVIYCVGTCKQCMAHRKAA